MRDHHAKAAKALVLAIIMSLAYEPSSLSAQGLTPVEQDAYLIWLHALESTIASRHAAGLSDKWLLYPRIVEGSHEASESSLLDVARALEDIESRPRLLQEPMSAQALHAVNRARNYAHLAEYDSALAWYEKAAQRDAMAEFTADIGRETMVAAIATRSAQTVRNRMRDLLKREDSADREPELELVFRFLLATADTAHVTELVDNLATRSGVLSGRVSYWHAFSFNWLGRWAESLDLLKELVVADGYSHGLDESQRAWVLVAIADQLFLLGAREAAAPLYRALAASSLGEAAVWAACQVAAFDLLAGHFLKAGTALEHLCNMKDNRVWRQHACRLAYLSDELERLRSEGRSHGADVFYNP